MGNLIDISTVETLPRWLSVTEACKYASMSDKTLMRHVRNGEIYGTKKGGKWFIDRCGIDSFFFLDKAQDEDWLEKHREGGA